MVFRSLVDVTLGTREPGNKRKSFWTDADQSVPEARPRTPPRPTTRDTQTAIPDQAKARNEPLRYRS